MYLLLLVLHVYGAGEVNGGGTFVFLLEDVVFAGEDRVEADADDGGDSEAGEAHDADLDAAGVADADRKNEYERGDDDVSGVGEVDLVLNNVAHTDCRDHTVEDEGHAADGRGGHCGDESSKLRAEGDEDRDAGCDADDAGVVDLGQREDAGVFTVGGVRGAAEECCQGGCQTVAEEGAVEAGVRHEVLADGGGYCADVADVLDHGGEGQGDYGEDRGPEQRGVNLASEEAEHGAVPVNGKADPCCVGDCFGDGSALCGVNDECEDVGAEDAEEDGDDLGHALAPHIEADDDRDGNDGDEPVGLAVIDSGGGEGQADGDDDGAGDDGREEAHDFLDAEGLEEDGENNIHQTCDKNAEACIGQERVVINRAAVSCRADGADGVVAADESERTAEEGRNLAAGEQVEEQGADTGEKKRGSDVKSGQSRNKHGGAEHGEHVLEAEQQHLGGAELACVVNGAVDGGFLVHSIYLSQ